MVMLCSLRCGWAGREVRPGNASWGVVGHCLVRRCEAMQGAARCGLVWHGLPRRGLAVLGVARSGMLCCGGAWLGNGMAS